MTTAGTDINALRDDTGNRISRPKMLFQGKWFWVSMNVPLRKWFIDMIEGNGGFVTVDEKSADIKLVDHTRRNIPPDAYSYEFVEKSVKNARLENLEHHRVGSRPQRPVGATWIPHKTQRSVYTLEDDQFLWDCMQPIEQKGQSVGGNKVYQEIAEKNPRHSYQSWRDRYLKRLRGKPRPGRPVPVPTDRNEPQVNGVPEAPGNATQHSARQTQPSQQDDIFCTAPTHQLVEESPSPPAVKREPETDGPAYENTDSTSSAVRTASPKEPTELPPSSPAINPEPELDVPARKNNKSDTGTVHKAPTQKRGEVPPSSSAAHQEPEPYGSSKNYIDLNSNATRGNRKRKRSSEDNESPESFGLDYNYYANQKRRLLGPIAEAVISSPNPRNATFRNKRNTETTNHGAGSENGRPAPLSPSQDEFNELNDTLYLLTELPFFPPSPGAQGESEEDEEDEEEGDLVSEQDQDIDTWIDTRLQTGEAKNVEQVIEALRCTSMDPRLAGKVLGHLVAGKGIPRNMPGVWTAEEDRILEGNDARSIERVYKKHGPEYFNARWEYLEFARNSGLERGTDA